MLLQRSKLHLCIVIISLSTTELVYSVEFNTDILDATDRNNIDLSRFSTPGYIAPGTYLLNLTLNGKVISEQEIVFTPPSPAGDAGDVHICLTRAQTALLGLKPSALEKVLFDDRGTCADFTALSGVTLRADLSESALEVSVAQSWLEYQDSSWLPPSRWEDGIPGFILDYNLNSSVIKPYQNKQSQSLSANGTAGMNYGPWRVRGDWQARYDHHNNGIDRTFDWSQIYAWRALTGLMAKLTVGETSLMSSLFDGWRYTGVSLVSDESQLPPTLRGYAPEVSGIARTHARVTITQQGRVLYETTVAPGPFNIQSLSSAVSGQLDVLVEEQDGSIQQFQVATASVPYLTRPGQVRYKLAAGRPSDSMHRVSGPLFTTAEASWGVTNSWSLYGGGVFSADYLAFASGVGRDLFQFGAVSADITHSLAHFANGRQRQGRSYRLSYSKRFEEINSNLTFAGYRFSERDYMTMPEYLAAQSDGLQPRNSKSLYNVTASKAFSDLRLSLYLSWSHQTWWNQPETNRYSLSASRYFDIGNWRNLSASLSASRNAYHQLSDDALWLSVSLPLGSGTLSYSGNWNNDSFSQTTGWFQQLDNHDSYRLYAGTRSGGEENLTTQASGYYYHASADSDVTAGLSWQQNRYLAASLTLNGGLTLTHKGSALHGGGVIGGTRMLISTEGVPDVPLGANSKTNRFGFAVDPSVISYYRTTTEIDVTRLPDDVEAAGSPVMESVLTEGAIGFRRFNMLKGHKAIAYVVLEDGSHPPFGASVRDKKHRELGLIDDNGQVWLSGVTPGEPLDVTWQGRVQCSVTLPSPVPTGLTLLPCLPSAPANTEISSSLPKVNQP